MKGKPANDAYNCILRNKKRLRDSAGPDYHTVHDQYAFGIVRDTLLLLGILEAKASRMACERQGSAANRWAGLKPELKEMGLM